MMRLFIIFLLLGIEAVANVGKVYAVRGEGFIYRGTDKIAISLGSEIDEHDRIVTSKATKIQVIFEDRTIVTVGQNTEFSVNAYVYDKSPNSSLEFDMKKGIFKSITGKLGKLSPQNFKIKTKNSTIGIRGTTFVVSVTDNVTLLGTLAGKTYFIDQSTAKEYSVGVNQQLVYNSETKEIKVVPLKIRDVQIANPRLTSKEERQVAQAAEKVLDEVEEGGIPLDSITDEIVEVVDVENIEEIKTLASNLIDDFINDSPTEQRTYLTYGGSFGYKTDIDGYAHSPFLDGDYFSTYNYSMNSAYGSYSGVVEAITEGKVSLGTMSLYADFGNYTVDGTMSFTDAQNRAWALYFTSGMSDSGFDSYGASIYTELNSDVTITDGSINGRFFGDSTASQPTIGADSVGGTFWLTGTDTSGTAVDSEGAFGAWLSGTTPVATNTQVVYMADVYYSYGYWVDTSGVVNTPWADGIPLEQATLDGYYIAQAFGTYYGDVMSITSSGIVKTDVGSFMLSADFLGSTVTGYMTINDADANYWDVQFTGPINGANYTGPVTINTTSTFSNISGTASGTFYGAPDSVTRVSTMPEAGTDATAGTFTIQGDNGGASTTITGAFGGVAGGV